VVPVPAFPIDVLPPAVRAYVADAAASLSASAEMVAVPLLEFVGSTIGNRLHLILKHSYREYPTLYLTIVPTWLSQDAGPQPGAVAARCIAD